MRLLTAILIAALPTPVMSEDFPGYGGTAQSQSNPASITWQCTPSQTSPIRCTLAETLLMRPPALDLETEVASMLTTEAFGECPEIEEAHAEMLATVRAQVAAGRLSERQAGIATQFVDALERVCSERSREAVASFVDLQNDVASRSCQVSTSLREVKLDWNASSTRWESVSPPTGGCGEIDITAMEKADGFFWNLRRQVIVTNRSGTDVLGGSCSAKPDRNELYEWKTRDLDLGCEFLKFGY